jgi:hypothetical protein
MKDRDRVETALRFMGEERASLADMYHRKTGHQEMALKLACQSLFWFFVAHDILREKHKPWSKAYKQLLAREPELSGLTYARHHATHGEISLLDFLNPLGHEGAAYEMIWAVLPPLSGRFEQQNRQQSADYKNHLEGKRVLQALNRVQEILPSFVTANL